MVQNVLAVVGTVLDRDRNPNPFHESGDVVLSNSGMVRSPELGRFPSMCVILILSRCVLWHSAFDSFSGHLAQVHVGVPYTRKK